MASDISKYSLCKSNSQGYIYAGTYLSKCSNIRFDIYDFAERKMTYDVSFETDDLSEISKKLSIGFEDIALKQLIFPPYSEIDYNKRILDHVDSPTQFPFVVSNYKNVIVGIHADCNGVRQTFTAYHRCDMNLLTFIMKFKVLDKDNGKRFIDSMLNILEILGKSGIGYCDVREHTILCKYNEFRETYDFHLSYTHDYHEQPAPTGNHGYMCPLLSPQCFTPQVVEIWKESYDAAADKDAFLLEKNDMYAFGIILTNMIINRKIEMTDGLHHIAMGLLDSNGFETATAAKAALAPARPVETPDNQANEDAPKGALKKSEKKKNQRVVFIDNNNREYVKIKSKTTGKFEYVPVDAC